MGEKRAKQNFPETNHLSEQKMLGKNRRKKLRKKLFLYSHEYRDQEMGGGKKRVKLFFQKHTNSARNICWGKNRWKKVRKQVFL